MPERFPLPPGGPQPIDERDLDCLLAGNTCDLPVALRPVAETLAALRAAPAPRELAGEELARAAYRAPRSGDPVPPSVLLDLTARRRPARRPRRGWVTGLVAAAAVIIAATVTYTGNLPGPAQQLAHDTIAAPPVKDRPSASPRPSTVVSSARPAPVPTSPTATAIPTPPPAGSAPDRATLCNALRSTRQHPQADSRTRWWRTQQYHELITAAGGPQYVAAYCAPVWQQPGHRNPQPSFPPPASPSQRVSSQAPTTPGQGQQSGSSPGGSNGQQPGGSPSAGAGSSSSGKQDG